MFGADRGIVVNLELDSKYRRITPDWQKLYDILIYVYGVDCTWDIGDKTIGLVSNSLRNLKEKVREVRI